MSCLLAYFLFPLYSTMYSLCENMMCGLRVPWLVRHSNNNEAGAGFCKVSVDCIIAIIIIKNELFLKK